MAYNILYVYIVGIPVTHFQLIRMAHALGYQSVGDKGLCQGYSAMWMQAVCSGDLATFNKRYALLEKYADKPEMLGKKINALREALRQNTGKIISQKEHDLLEIPAFFEGVATYLHPEIRSEVFGKTGVEQKDALLIAGYVQSLTLEQAGGISRVFNTSDQYDETKLLDFGQVRSGVTCPST